MPRPGLVHHHQRAVLWNKVGVDSYGQPTVSNTPIELAVRWDDSRKEVRAANTATITIDATVVVDRVIAIGSYMWKGKINQLPGSALVPETDVMVVYSQEVVPDVKNRSSYYEVLLMRLKDLHV